MLPTNLEPLPTKPRSHVRFIHSVSLRRTFKHSSKHTLSLPQQSPGIFFCWGIFIFILVALPGWCVTAMPYQCCLQAEPESRGGATAKRAFLCCSSRMPCAGKVHISAYQYDRTLKRLRCFYLAGTESVIVFEIQPARFLKCKYTGTHAHAQYTL